MASTGSIFVDESGSGPCVLLLHGQPGTHEHLSPVKDLLTGRARVLSIDRPGYGRSHMPTSPPGDQAAQLVDLLREREATPAIVVAHSYAAAVALLMAADHPDAIAGLVLVAGVGGRGSVVWVDRVMAAPVVGGPISTASLLAYGLIAPVIAHLGGRTRLATNVPVTPTTWLLESRATFLAEQRFLVEHEDTIEARRREVRCPVVVIQGEVDDVVPLSAGRDLAMNLPDARLVVLPGAGHLLPRDEPRAIAAAVSSLLEAPGTSSRT